jgi:hypothetical protein
VKPTDGVLWGDGGDAGCDGLIESVEEASLGSPKAFFDLGPSLLDGIEIRHSRRGGMNSVPNRKGKSATNKSLSTRDSHP